MLGLVSNLVTSSATIRTVAKKVGLKEARLSHHVTTKPVLGVTATKVGTPAPLLAITVAGSPAKKIRNAANELARVAINSVGGKLILLRGTGGSGHWLELRLPRFAPGAVVTAVLPDGRRLVREVVAGSSYLSSEDPRVHFGLGGATRVKQLIVRYPGGNTTRLSGVTADRIVSAP